MSIRSFEQKRCFHQGVCISVQKKLLKKGKGFKMHLQVNTQLFPGKIKCVTRPQDEKQDFENHEQHETNSVFENDLSYFVSWRIIRILLKDNLSALEYVRKIRSNVSPGSRRKRKRCTLEWFKMVSHKTQKWRKDWTV